MGNRAIGFCIRLIALFGLASPSFADGAYVGRINGEFHGWDGETVYELQDGHIIKQSLYHYHYHYAYSPKVIIYQDGPGFYKIHVEDDDDDDVNITVLK